MTPRIYEGHPNAVPVGPLRDRFIKLFNRGEVTAELVAERLGWGDGGVVFRALGLKPNTSHGTSRYQTVMEIDTAVRLGEALGMDPHEWDGVSVREALEKIAEQSQAALDALDGVGV